MERLKLALCLTLQVQVQSVPGYRMASNLMDVCVSRCASGWANISPVSGRFGSIGGIPTVSFGELAWNPRNISPHSVNRWPGPRFNQHSTINNHSSATQRIISNTLHCLTDLLDEGDISFVICWKVLGVPIKKACFGKKQVRPWG